MSRVDTLRRRVSHIAGRIGAPSADIDDMRMIHFLESWPSHPALSAEEQAAAHRFVCEVTPKMLAAVHAARARGMPLEDGGLESLTREDFVRARPWRDKLRAYEDEHGR